MGARLAFDKPLGAQRFPAQPHDSGANGAGGDDKGRSVGTAPPRFSLLEQPLEERRRRLLALGFSPVFEAFAVAIMLWALMSLPPTSVPGTTKEEVVYFRTTPPPKPLRQAPRLLERLIPRQALTQKPVVPKLQQPQIQKPLEVARLKVPEITHPKIELPQTPPAPKPAESFTAAEAPRPAPKRQMAMLHLGAFNPGSMAKATVKRPLTGC